MRGGATPWHGVKADLPNGRLGQSGRKHNAVRTKLLCRAILEKVFSGLYFYSAGLKILQIVDLRDKASEGVVNIDSGSDFVLADYRAREGFVTAETGENLLAREIICENEIRSKIPSILSPGQKYPKEKQSPRTASFG